MNVPTSRLESVHANEASQVHNRMPVYSSVHFIACIHTSLERIQVIKTTNLSIGVAERAVLPNKMSDVSQNITESAMQGIGRGYDCLGKAHEVRVADMNSRIEILRSHSLSLTLCL